jgi:hypothetical protein
MLSLVAYIDPSSGSLAVQFLIAAVLSAGVVLRNYVFWPVAWAMRLLRGRRGASEHANR